MSDSEVKTYWFSVRCVFQVSGAGAYEERITLWKVREFSEAISCAENEAREYSETLDGLEYLGLAQGFLLADEPGQGSEVFSLIRESDLSKDEYLDTFFDTGTEHQTRIHE